MSLKAHKIVNASVDLEQGQIIYKDYVNVGIAVDTRKNESRSMGAREIQTDDGSVKILVIPTNEELEIAEETVECIQRSG